MSGGVGHRGGWAAAWSPRKVEPDLLVFFQAESVWRGWLPGKQVYWVITPFGWLGWVGLVVWVGWSALKNISTAT